MPSFSRCVEFLPESKDSMASLLQKKKTLLGLLARKMPFRGFLLDPRDPEIKAVFLALAKSIKERSRNG
jgi:hypothetical protein